MEIVLENFSKFFGKVQAIEDMTLTIRDGEMLALLGPSGCGKTTTLFAICGIHKVSRGRILFNGQDICDVPIQRREVGVVFQSYALYPHLSVYENIAFPLRIRKDPPRKIDAQVRRYADLVHIAALLDRRPGQLSGGQQQRVALARALVREPGVLLLDEPLANLDAKLRLEMRSEIRRIQQETGITAILVTHDQVEAMSMCDRIAIMRAGAIQQVASPMDMYHNPANHFVAGFLGNPPISFLRGEVRDGRFHRPAAGIDLPLPPMRRPPADGTTIELGIRPEYLQPDAPEAVSGTISFVEAQGREALFDLTLADGSILRSVQRSGATHAVGDTVRWGVAPDRLLAFDAAGNRL